MSKITDILLEAIGDDKTERLGDRAFENGVDYCKDIGYNQALADLRAKIPDIEKKIVEEIVNQIAIGLKEKDIKNRKVKVVGVFGYYRDKAEEIIKNLTS